MDRRLHSAATRVARAFAENERGATAIEYALVAAGIATAIISTVMALGTTVQSLYAQVAGML